MLDAAQPRILHIEPDLAGGYEGALISEIDLSTSGLTGLKGIARDPETGHFHILSRRDKRLYELNENGLIVAYRDLSGMDLVNPGGMVFALSGDLTDDPTAMSLYIADSRSSDEVTQSALSANSPDLREAYTAGEGSGDILELSFAEPAAAQAPTFQATLIQTIFASQWSPPSPDSAGVVYLPASGTLLVSDSEVNEMAIFEGANVFEATLLGELLDTLARSMNWTRARMVSMARRMMSSLHSRPRTLTVPMRRASLLRTESCLSRMG
jgi:hypothetical protein